MFNVLFRVHRLGVIGRTSGFTANATRFRAGVFIGDLLALSSFQPVGYRTRNF